MQSMDLEKVSGMITVDPVTDTLGDGSFCPLLWRGPLSEV